MMLVVIIILVGTSVNKVVAIAIGAVVKMYCQTAADSTLPLSGSVLHPTQGDIVCFLMGNALWLDGKARTPHFWQYIEISTLVAVNELLRLKDILLWLCPTDISLEKCCFQYS